jgi:hypothetical protein
LGILLADFHVYCGWFGAMNEAPAGETLEKKALGIIPESFESMGVAVQAIVGCLIMTGAIAIVLFLATGKW